MSLSLSHPSTAVIILAGGESRRLGRPKQTLSYQGDFLINHAVRAALGTKPARCKLVLGANADVIRQILIPSQSLDIVNCDDWKSGMGASIQCGMSKLPDDVAQVILMVGDQPFVDSLLLTKLLEKAASAQTQLACSAYGDELGVPALFGKKYFQLLRNLEGKGGAKKVLKKHTNDLITVPFPKGVVDVDTEKDYQALLKEDWGYFEKKPSTKFMD